jgi:mRNA interferase MazF
MAGSWVPDRRDIIWINHDPKAGKEMPGEHPLMVLSVKAFNERTGIVIGLPMTHSALNDDNPFAVKFTGPKGEACYVLCHQPKSFDWRARRARAHPWRQITPAVFRTACEELGSILQI